MKHKSESPPVKSNTIVFCEIKTDKLSAKHISNDF